MQLFRQHLKYYIEIEVKWLGEKLAVSKINWFRLIPHKHPFASSSLSRSNKQLIPMGKIKSVVDSRRSSLSLFRLALQHLRQSVATNRLLIENNFLCLNK